MIDYRPVDQREADEMFTRLPKEQKWQEVVAQLLQGRPLFIPYMSRNQLETLRNIVNRRRLGRLRSKTQEMDGQPGRILRLGNPLPRIKKET